DVGRRRRLAVATGVGRGVGGDESPTLADGQRQDVVAAQRPDRPGDDVGHRPRRADRPEGVGVAVDQAEHGQVVAQPFATAEDGAASESRRIGPVNQRATPYDASRPVSKTPPPTAAIIRPSRRTGSYASSASILATRPQPPYPTGRYAARTSNPR